MKLTWIRRKPGGSLFGSFQDQRDRKVNLSFRNLRKNSYSWIGVWFAIQIYRNMKFAESSHNVPHLQRGIRGETTKLQRGRKM